MFSENKILIVDDEPMIRWMLSQTLREWNYVPFEAANVEDALRLFDTEQPILTLLDINLPDGSGLNLLRTIKTRQPKAVVIMVSGNVLVETTIAAFRAGAGDFISKPINLEELQFAIRKSIEAARSHLISVPAVNKPAAYFSFEQIIGESSKMKELIALAKKVAENDFSSILLQGETGTGKDLIAQSIHYASAHSDKPFVAVNCAAIPANLIESELFGYEKGAFTDAKSTKEGLFEQAKGGTIFLDEIGEIELGLQAKLLRVLEAKILRRVGGIKNLPINAYVIAASNRNLREDSETGSFRRDLYFRLSVIELKVPPLRERGDDVVLLAEHFIETLDRSRFKSTSRKLAPETVEIFRRYHWDGNVRELRNAVERVLMLEEGTQITPKYLPPALSRQTGSTSDFHKRADDHHSIQLPPGGISLEAVEDSLIEQALRHTGGNVTRAARSLNISRDRMRYYLKKKRLNKPD